MPVLWDAKGMVSSLMIQGHAHVLAELSTRRPTQKMVAYMQVEHGNLRPYDQGLLTIGFL